MSKFTNENRRAMADVKEAVMESYFMADRATELLYEAGETDELPAEVGDAIEEARVQFVHAFDTLDMIVRPIGGDVPRRSTDRLRQVAEDDERDNEREDFVQASILALAQRLLYALGADTKGPDPVLSDEANWLLCDMQRWAVCHTPHPVDQRLINRDGTYYVDVEQLVHWMTEEGAPDLTALPSRPAAL